MQARRHRSGQCMEKVRNGFLNVGLRALVFSGRLPRRQASARL
jgi:hypothetical protein